MQSLDAAPFLAFVWRPIEIAHTVTHMSGSAPVRAVFDLSGADPGAFAPALVEAGAADVEVSCEFFLSQDLLPFLNDTRITTLWVEIHPALSPGVEDSFQERAKEVTSVEGRHVIPVSGDPEFLSRLAHMNSYPDALALKGSEASGFVSTETTGILYAMLRDLTRNRDRAPGLVLWGGIATPEAAAAFLATGARGVVFESLHWCTDLVQAPSEAKKRIAGLRPHHTALVGRSMGIPCRVFDRGNSMAVKEIAGAAKEEPRAFCREIRRRAVHPLDSDPGRKGIAFMGPEASFARGFSLRYGEETEQAVRSFAREVFTLSLRTAEASNPCTKSPMAEEMGTRYPVIQGAMSWISDIPAFAEAVSRAGGLPTLALGMKDGSRLDRDLESLETAMGDRPYAVNIVALPENPFLKEQLAWIDKHLPPFVVVAAGEPYRALEIKRLGLKVMYIAPDEGLMRMALEAGTDCIILEGNEAGGHVGEHSTLILAQIALDLRRREPELFEGRRVVLAGGIYDRDTAFRAFMLGADAVQMGTAYLATNEIVTTGALSPLYRRLILQASPGSAVVSGGSTGLRVRSLRTAKLDRIHSLEMEFVRGLIDEQAFRNRLEALSAGSLLIAARGVDSPDGGPALDEETCLREGQFMSGSVAGLINRPNTIAELHRDVVEGFQGPAFSSSHSAAHRPPVRIKEEQAESNRIAVTGMAMVNALGRSPGEIWEAALAMKSGITEIPASRWDYRSYYDPDPRAPGKTYCRTGAFQDLSISRKDLDVAPQDFRTMTDSTRLTLWLAERAVRESGILESEIPRERIGVVICQNSGEAAATMSDLVLTIRAREIVESLRGALVLSPEQEKAAENAIREGRISVDDTTLLGRLNSTAAGFLCNRYGFQGPSYAVTAACAGGLVALYTAVQMIRAGVIDAAVVGGGEERLYPSHYLEFSALRALAGLSGVERPPEESSRPFDSGRDGMVLGEGGAVIVIERAGAAKAGCAPVHAWITGVGASNSHQGMVESLAGSQEIAMTAAFKDAGYGPETVDLVACHATGTIQGDVEEIKALERFFARGRRTALCSFKSQIGHTLGASGLMSLIHGVTAMKEEVFPCTLNYNRPDPEIDLEGWGFHVPGEPVDWEGTGCGPRRLMVNAFGFGGANYVVHLESDSNVPCARALVPGAHAGRDDMRLEPGASGVPGVMCVMCDIKGDPYRLGVPAEQDWEVRRRLDSLKELLAEVPFTGSIARALSRKGVFAAPASGPPLPLAFVFTGQGSQYRGAGLALYRTFPEFRRWMDRIAGVASFDLPGLLFDSGEDTLRNTRWQQPALYTLEYAMARSFMALGVEPSAMAGHSLGELVALSLAGVFSWEDGFRIVDKRAQCMEQAASMTRDPGIMIAVDAPLTVLEEMTSNRKGVFFTNYNSPRQTVMGGGTGEVRELAGALKAEGYRATQLDVSMAFHSPVMSVIREDMAAFVEDIPFHAPRIPVVSNTTKRPFTNDPAEIRRTLMAHLESPVHWMQNVETLWHELGVRLFVEFGPRDTLCGLITDTIEEAECIPACLPEDEVGAYRSAAARLFSLGHLVPPADPIRHEISNKTGQMTNIKGEPNRSAASNTKSSPEPASSRLSEDTLEAMIRIIMEATGYERYEIEPDMDLRQDLSIRSSRLPVIMAAAEKHFNIVVRVEDFMGLRTVREVAERIGQLSGSGRVSPEGRIPLTRAASFPRHDARPPLLETPSDTSERPPLRRLVFEEKEVDLPVRQPRRPWSGGRVVLLSPDRGSDQASALSKLLERRLGTAPLALSCLKQGDPHGDLCSHQGIERLVGSLKEIPSLYGLVLLLDSDPWDPIQGPDACPSLLTGFFTCLKTFLSSKEKAFALALRPAPSGAFENGPAWEGIKGMFLAAALEHPDTIFRCVGFDEPAGLEKSISGLLHKELSLLSLNLRQGRWFSARLKDRPLQQGGAPRLEPGPSPVIVLSGGARGITSRLALSLVPLAPRIVLLGRTEPASPDGREKGPGDPGPQREAAETLAELARQGIEVSYFRCDVSDREQADKAIAEAASRYGRVDGIIHGAGLTRDALIPFMTPADFDEVVRVKLHGAWNLFRAARDRGLGFFVALSSMAAVQGNMGQANYCAANRAMTGLMDVLGRSQNSPAVLTLMLPPMEGAGMAEDPEIRELMRLKGLEKAFVHVDELAGLFPMELLAGPSIETTVVPARAVPRVKTVLPPSEAQGGDESRVSPWAVLSDSSRLPMLDKVLRADPASGRLSALRTFSHSRDPWLEDHRPFHSLKHPIVSGIMAVEAFLEAARLLTPYLGITGVRRISFLDILECPAGSDREAWIECRRLGIESGRLISRVNLSAALRSPTGRKLDDRTPCFEGEVLQGPPSGTPTAHTFNAAVSATELDSRPMDSNEVQAWYDRRTALSGRYRVIETMDGSGPGVAAGWMVYSMVRDSIHEGPATYQYSAYLLEALMHLASFYVVMRDEEDTRRLIPAGISEAVFGRPCATGERIRLQGRLASEDSRGLLWDLRGITDEDEPLMQVHGLRMDWFKG